MSRAGLTGDDSNVFNVTARTLVIGNVSNVRAGDVFGVSVTAVDAQAVPQTAENFNGSVSLSNNVPAGGSGFAIAPSPANASAGSVTFGNLQLLNAADGYSVSAAELGTDRRLEQFVQHHRPNAGVPQCG